MQLFFLADFSVIRPDPGTIFWTSIIFLLVWFGLGKVAFKPIQQALKKRDGDIQNALDEAKRARDEMAKLQASNEQLLIEAREERTKILREAKEAKEATIKEAREQAKLEAQRIVTNAQQDIDNMRQAAVTDLKNQVGQMAIEIAEKLLRKELAGQNEHETFVNKLVDEMNLN